MTNKLTLQEALEHATFVADPRGVFYRVNSYDAEADDLYLLHEDSGEEQNLSSESVRGWRILTLTDLEYI